MRKIWFMFAFLVSGLSFQLAHADEAEALIPVPDTAPLPDATGTEVYVNADHAEAVTAIAYSPDERFFATGSNDKTAKIWDAKTGRVIYTLVGNKSKVTSVAFSPDSKTLATGSLDSGIKEWDVATGRELRRAKHTYEYDNYVVYSPDGQTLISAGSNIKFWDAKTGKKLRLIKSKLGNAFYAVAISPDGLTLAAKEGNGLGVDLKLWDVRSGKELRTLSAKVDSFSPIVFSPDSRKLATSEVNGPLGKPDQEHNIIKIWDVASGSVIQSVDRGYQHINAIAFSPDGRQLVTGGGHDDVSLDYTNLTIAWDVATGKKLGSFVAQGDSASGGASTLAFSPDGAVVAAGYGDGKVAQWNVATRQEVGASSPDAQQSSDATGRSAHRPNIPVPIGEEAWQAIEQSEAFRNLPTSKTVKVHIVETHKNSGKLSFVSEDDTEIELRMIAPGWIAQKRNTKSKMNGADSSRSEMTQYYLGSLYVGGVLGGKVMENTLQRFDEIKGSLFPMRSGAEFSIRPIGTMIHSKNCHVGDKLPASIIHAKLKGNAWVVDCISSSDYYDDRKFRDYFLEEIGLFASMVGIGDMGSMKAVIPKAGHTYKWEFNGDQITVVIDKFEWQVID